MKNLDDKIKYNPAPAKTLDKIKAEEFADLRARGLENVSTFDMYEYMLGYHEEDRRDQKNYNQIILMPF